MIALRAGSATDVGLVRTTNQDFLLVTDLLFAVADGMGGAAAGEVASETAIEALGHDFAAGDGATPDGLVQAAQAANRAVWEKAEANPAMRGMGTTLVALTPIGEDQIGIINVGDSRLYAMRDGELRQVTTDHNLVAEMVAQGRISPEEAEVHPRRNIMTRALGVDPDVEVDYFAEDVLPGDRYLLCSDGLPRELRDDQIAALLRHLADPGEAARELVDEAKRRGGNDNITVVVVDVVDAGTAPAEADHDVKDATVALPAALVGETEAAPEVVEEPRPSRRQRRQERRAAGPPRARPITIRVVAFIVILLIILGGGAAGMAWYARSAYYVGIRGNQLLIYKGRPGGVLWFHPTVAEVTSTTTADVEPSQVQYLAAGVQESSVSAAHQYISRLVAQQQAAQAQLNPLPTPTTVPVPTTTHPVTTKTTPTTVRTSPTAT